MSPTCDGFIGRLRAIAKLCYNGPEIRFLNREGEYV
jgi:hypothetical protein